MPQRKVAERTIDGIALTSTQPEVMRALALLPRLATAIGAGLPAMLAAKQSGKPVPTNVGASLFMALDSSEIQVLARELLITCTAVVDGKPIHLGGDDAINAVFAGAWLTLLKAMWFVVEAHYIGPLRESLASAAPALAQASPSTSPT